MNRILFVDDDPGVLEGLRNALRRERGRWEMVFAHSAQDALDVADRKPFDLVVTDMRMPGMDGAELLARMREKSPATARIMLSGQADQGEILRALPVAHRFFSKPCEPAQLRDAIDRTCRLKRILPTGDVRRTLGALDHLPASASVHDDLVRDLADPNVGASAIAGHLERDPAMAVRVLQLVNSAYFGNGQPTASIPAAVRFIGVEFLRTLVIAGDVFPAPESGSFSQELERITAHSLRVARLMRRLFDDATKAAEAFTLGLVHDVGKMALARSFPDAWVATCEAMAARGVQCHVMEQEVFGVTHAEAGACLLGLWGLPISIVDAVAFHHRPSAGETVDRGLLAALHFADTVCADERADGVTPFIDEEFLATAVPHGLLQAWRSVAAETSARPC
jgi:putative nucleotidyltransferase with HDIG domain